MYISITYLKGRQHSKYLYKNTMLQQNYIFYNKVAHLLALARDYDPIVCI